ncbi:MAG: ATP-binding protein [Candidatus Saccharibacteria bacterium]|nr:ATP-binding protein [Candidatus Saccharibacteria bacterium]
MKEIKRDVYLNKLISARENGLIKILTGIRRCGKSYMLDPIFKNYLLAEGVDEGHIIKINLDDIENGKYLKPEALNEYIRSKITDRKMYYIMIDEVQKVENFESVLNGLLYLKNVDIYVTGSNSRFLSSDIVTEFRGRGTEIRIRPLSFAEFMAAYEGEKNGAWDEYVVYGGMPVVLSLRTPEEKGKYLNELFELTYKADIVERNSLEKDDALDAVINMLASSVGSLTNPQKIYNSFISNGTNEISRNTVTAYIGYLLDAFLIERAERYDVKGKKYIQTPQKYYFSDTGLRNARLNFRQLEEGHLMENVIYNELLHRGYNVDGGERKWLEIDFVCNQGYKRYYIQSALNMETREKNEQESRSLRSVDDNFKKIIIVKDSLGHWYNDEGVLVMGMEEFLLNPESLDL